jgi:hypothetical protein
VGIIYPEYERGKEELLKIVKGRADEEKRTLEVETF